MTDLNMTSILAASLVGVQRRGLEKFFGAMGILPPVQVESYQQYAQQLFASVHKEAEKSTKVAAEEARAHFQSNDITVSIDGTWLTQGFSSLHGVGTVVSASDPPKVLDYEVLSRHCSELLEKHLQRGCEANYEGSSGGMEGASVGHHFSSIGRLAVFLDGYDVWPIGSEAHFTVHCIHRRW